MTNEVDGDYVVGNDYYTNAPTGPYIEYDSNNSGGYWWLEDKDWIALEKAGWYVLWGSLEFCQGKWNAKLPPVCSEPKKCNGHRTFESYQEMLDDKEKRYMGALARAARLYGSSRHEAVANWEQVTGQSSEDAGCSCCGQPHSFY